MNMKKASLYYIFLLVVNLNFAQSNAIVIYQSSYCAHREVDPSILFQAEKELTITEHPPRDNSITKGGYMPAFIDQKIFEEFDVLLLKNLETTKIDSILPEQFRIVYYDSKRQIMYSYCLYGLENSKAFFKNLISQVSNSEIQRLLNYHLEWISICEDLKNNNK
jgi:hypothetical protein